MKSRKARIIRLIGSWLAVLLVACGAAALMFLWTDRNAPPVQTAEARLGEFVDYLQLRGEVRARSSTFVSAPFNAGELQIIKLCPNGARVGKGDVVVEFDTMTLQRTVDQNRSALKQVDAEIDRLKAQQKLQQEQSLTDEMKVRYDIERAKLEVGKEEVLTAIEVEKARLGLAKAEQKLIEFQAKMASNRVGVEADLAASMQKRAKAQADLEQAERNKAALTLRAPINGIVTLMPNYRARTGFGLTAPVFKEGDRGWAGAPIAEIPDLATIQVNAPVDESERGRIALQQSVSLRIDAVPDKEHKGVVAAVSPLARPDYSGWPIKKNFDLTIRLEQMDPRLRPGMSATARIAVERLPDSILVPVEAVFEKNGRTVCYVQDNGRFVEQIVEVTRRGEGQALIARGLAAGRRVTLKDPTLETGKK